MKLAEIALWGGAAATAPGAAAVTAPGNMFSDSHPQGSSDRHVQDSVAEVACASKPQEGWQRRRIGGGGGFAYFVFP
jgi:hypothetical protein